MLINVIFIIILDVLKYSLLLIFELEFFKLTFTLLRLFFIFYSDFLKINISYLIKNSDYIVYYLFLIISNEKKLKDVYLTSFLVILFVCQLIIKRQTK